MKKRFTKTIAVLTVIITAASLLGSNLHAFIFNNLDTNTAVAGASLKLQDFYSKNPDAEARLKNFFYPEPEIVEGEFFEDEVLYENEKTGVVSAEALLNVRADATVNSEALWTLNRGDQIRVIGERKQKIVSKEESQDFTWYKVKGEDFEGFVRGEFLAFGEEAIALAEKLEEEKNGKMPGEFVLGDEVNGANLAQLQSLAKEINWCQNLYNTTKTKNGQATESDTVNLYSILVYLSDLYQNVAAIAKADNFSVTYNRAVNGKNIIAKERDRLSVETGKTEEDFYRGIQMESEEYKRQQAAAEEAARLAREAEQRRLAQEQAAREAANEAARREAEERARQAAAEAERQRQAQAAAEAAARQAAQEEAARIAAAGSGEGGGSVGRQIADYAATFIGILPYVWGGASLTSGADCSGFIGQIMAHFGLLDQGTANRHGYDSYGLRSVGSPVTYDASSLTEFVKYLAPGDIVCYDGHVAIYYGNGIVVHEPSVGRKAEYGSVMMMPIRGVRRLAQ